MSTIDDNNEYAALAWDDTNSTTAKLKVDTSTTRLLVDITVTTSTSPTLDSATFDDNNELAALAYNDTNPAPLLIDNRNGLLWCDVNQE